MPLVCITVPEFGYVARLGFLKSLNKLKCKLHIIIPFASASVTERPELLNAPEKKLCLIVLLMLSFERCAQQDIMYSSERSAANMKNIFASQQENSDRLRKATQNDNTHLL